MEVTAAIILTDQGEVFGIAVQDRSGCWDLIKQSGFYVEGATGLHNSQVVRIGPGCLQSYLSGFDFPLEMKFIYLNTDETEGQKFLSPT